MHFFVKHLQYGLNLAHSIYWKSITFWKFLYKINHLYRGSYMSAHVLLNLLNELGKRDKMRGLSSILSLFCNEFNKFNNTRARMLDSIYHMTNTLKSDYWRKKVIILSLCTQRCYGRHNVSCKSINHKELIVLMHGVILLPDATTYDKYKKNTIFLLSFKYLWFKTIFTWNILQILCSTCFCPTG